MRRVYLLFVLAVACPGAKPPNPPPTGSFYFPTGLHHFRPPGSMGEGVLYVVSSNFDKRYDTGLLTAVDLDKVGLPPFGVFTDAGSVTIADLKVDPDAGTTVALASFGSNIAAWQKPDGGERLFVVARSENRYLMAVDTGGPTDPTRLRCITALTVDAGANLNAPTSPQDCSTAGASLTYNELSNTGVPRAPSPLMTAVSNDGIVWVTSGDIVDSPRGSGMMLAAYVVRAYADDSIWGGPPGHFHVDDNDFISVGPVPTDGVTVGQRWAYVTGRYAPTAYNSSFAYSGYTPQGPGANQTYSATGYPTGAPGSFLTTTATTVLVRLLDATNLVNVSLELEYAIPDSRGIALSSDESRLYLLGRLTPYVVGSDRLIVASIGDPLGNTTGTSVNVVRTVPLCDEPQEVRTVPRAGRSDLVIITCSGGAVAAQGGATAAGVLALYDDDVGNLVGQVPNIGLQPDSLAIDVRPGGSCPDHNLSTSCLRVFVSNFTDGRVAMIDVPDMNRPQDARLRGYLGAAQTCVTRNFSDTSCDGGLAPIPDGGT